MSLDRQLLITLAAVVLQHPNFRLHLTEEQQAEIFHYAKMQPTDSAPATLYERVRLVATQNE